MQAKAEVTVIVGRFQIDQLHSAHMALIREAVKSASNLCIILLGYGDKNPTEKDPLPVGERESMIENFLFNEKMFSNNRGDYDKDIYVGSIKDMPFSDQAWSDQVDEKVDSIIEKSSCPGSKKVLMVGGRDSFIKYYTGQYITYDIGEVNKESGTFYRNNMLPPSTAEQSLWYRKGMIDAQVKKPYPNIYPTVDAIVYRFDSGDHYILLGKKKGETTWRLPGGFLDAKDSTLESAVMREVHEECGLIELGVPEYFCSSPLDDRRYQGAKDTVYTTVFKMQYIFGAAEPGDDLAEVRWFHINGIREGRIPLLDLHKPIIESYVQT